MFARQQIIELNKQCPCMPIPPNSVSQFLSKENRYHGQSLPIQPHEFIANTAVMVGIEDKYDMLAQISALETTAQNAGYKQYINHLRPHMYAPSTPVNSGLLMGYDFHITADGPQLIEINTNAGGAFIASKLLGAFNTDTNICTGGATENAPEVAINLLAMFQNEWANWCHTLPHRNTKLRRVAIIDSNPREQYLYPDMLLAQELLKDVGIECKIVDPMELHIQNRQLKIGDWPVDLVYNRLTDFDLSAPEHQILQQAWTTNLAVVSPNPTHHSLLANKGNFEIFTDRKLLKSWGIKQATQVQLGKLPTSQGVRAHNAPTLWAQKNKLFFKPTDGFAAKAAYSGKKLTRKKWAEITAPKDIRNYIAQSYVAPGERRVTTDNGDELMKYDVRLYTHASQLLLSTARIYRGQTTNFRTEGGGFAPVVYVD